MTDFDAEAMKTFADMIGANTATPVLAHNGNQVVLVPEGYTLEQIKPIDAPLPRDIYALPRFATGESFVEYVESFKTGCTRLFAQVTPPRATAHIDYHTVVIGDVAADPRRNAHRATYDMPYSPQWNRWTELVSKPFSQKVFMEFIEENGEDIVDPPVATMMEAVGTLQARKSIDFKSGIRLSDGSYEIQYSEQVDAGGTAGVKTATLPTQMDIGVPVFMDGETYRVTVLIRYRIDESKLSFQIVLKRREYVVEDAVKHAVEAIETATGLTALWGVAE